MMNAVTCGKALKRQGYAVGIIDLVFANCAVLIGFAYSATPYVEVLSTGNGWDSLIIQIFQVPFQVFIPIRFIERYTITFSLGTFLIESTLSILLIEGARKLSGRRLKIWFRIRLIFFMLTFIALIIRTVNSRFLTDPYVIIEQGTVGILYMIYRGYGLILVTFLEELAYKKLMGSIYQAV